MWLDWVETRATMDGRKEPHIYLRVDRRMQYSAIHYTCVVRIAFAGASAGISATSTNQLLEPPAVQFMLWVPTGRQSTNLPRSVAVD